MAHVITLPQVASTNTHLKQHAAALESGTVIVTPCQTAGRGQKGNSWESEPGKNLTFSMLIKEPQVPVEAQFAISEAVSLAIVDALSFHARGFTIKWPNDIYHDDRKICGILIEHSLEEGRIAHTVIGVGLNVNQRVFVSDAPNPVALTHITGKEHNLAALLERVCGLIESYCHFTPQRVAQQHKRYLELLYRGDGREHPFELPGGARVMATIVDVAPTGMLALRHHDGTLHHYAFKEVAFVVPPSKEFSPSQAQPQ